MLRTRAAREWCLFWRAVACFSWSKDWTLLDSRTVRILIATSRGFESVHLLVLLYLEIRALAGIEGMKGVVVYSGHCHWSLDDSAQVDCSC